MPHSFEDQIRAWLSRFSYKDELKNLALPLLVSLEEEGILRFQHEFALSALKVVDEMVQGQFPPSAADAFFTLIDLYLDEHGWKDKIPTDLEDVLFDGHLMHDYGNEFGPDLGEVRERLLRLAKG